MAFNPNFQPLFVPKNEKPHQYIVGTGNSNRSNAESLQQQRAPARPSKYILLVLHIAPRSVQILRNNLNDI